MGEMATVKLAPAANRAAYFAHVFRKIGEESIIR